MQRLFPSLAIFAVAIGAQAAPIRLSTGDLDTAAVPSMGQAGLAPALTGEGIQVVQFASAPSEDFLRTVAGLGVGFHHHLSDNAYLVRGDEVALSALSALPEVEWLGNLPGELKHFAGLLHDLDANDLVAVKMLSFDAEIPEALEGLGIAVGGTGWTPMGWFETQALLTADEVRVIRELADVFFIEAISEPSLLGERAAMTVAGMVSDELGAPIGPGYVAWLAANGLDGGDGVAALIMDDGVSLGGTPGTEHPDLDGRIIENINATNSQTAESVTGHGTVVAGSMIGAAGIPNVDLDGYLLGLGVAPSAGVFNAKVFGDDGKYDQHLSYQTILASAEAAGVRFSNNSWSCGILEGCAGEYDTSAALFDALTRDANVNIPGNQPMTFIFSAGNDGRFRPNGLNTIGSPGTAKNVITAGGTENSDAWALDGCGVGPLDADRHRELLDLASRGPTDDGRFGIDVVAPASHVFAAASRSPKFTAAGVCGSQDNDRFFPATEAYFPSGQSDHIWASGTSFSAPLITGSAMVVHEIFRDVLSQGPDGHPANPSPAMIRAVLTNTATDLSGEDNGFGVPLMPAPNPQQGWGLVNLGQLVDMQEHLVSVDQTMLFTGSGQQWSRVLVPADPNQPMRISLCWTDVPGAPLAFNALVNNLNLTVERGGKVYRGNVFSGGNSVEGGSADTRETLEAVHFENPGMLPITVTVTAAHLAGDGVPGNGHLLDQDFALFVRNATTVNPAGFVIGQPTHLRAGEDLNITVGDSDLSGAGSVMISAEATSGDVESLTLPEISGQGGLFNLTVSTSLQAVVPNDGILQVSGEDTITLRYADSDNGEAGALVVSDEVTVDGVAPQALSFMAVGQGLETVVVELKTDEPTTAWVGLGTECGSPNVIMASSLATEHQLVFSGLASGTAYQVSYEIIDEVGNAAQSPSCISVSTLRAVEIMRETFEGVPFAWQTTGLWHLVGPDSPYPDASSPTQSLWYGQDRTGDYDTGTQNMGQIISPRLQLPEGKIQLSFQSREQTEGAVPPFFADERRVFALVGSGRLDLFQSNEERPQFEEVGPVDLSIFAGQEIQVCWEFDTLDAIFNEFPGWYLDDIVLTALVSDEPTGPLLSVDHLLISEPVSGTAEAIFTLTLSEAVSHDVQAFVSTDNGTAKSGLDFNTVFQLITIPAGQTERQIPVTILPDALAEGVERFHFQVEIIQGARAHPVVAQGVITDLTAESLLAAVVQDLLAEQPLGGDLRFLADANGDLVITIEDLVLLTPEP